MITANPLPTSNPSGSLIGYNNLLTDSSTAAAGDIIPKSALTPNTFERYTPASGALTVKYNMGAVSDVNYIGIAAHALSGETLVIKTAPTTGSGTLTDVATISPSDNSPIFIAFDTRNCQEVVITSTLSAATEIGVIYMGMSMQMPTNLYGGHKPIALNANTKYQTSKSESGNVLGVNIIRKGLESSFSWKYLDDEWIRDTYVDFMDAARTTPIFLQWRPDFYSESAFGMVDGDISPSNMGSGHRLMQVSFKMSAHSDI